MGTMDILSKHLQLITQTFNGDHAGWKEKLATYRNVDLYFEPTFLTVVNNERSVELRNQGNVHFKAGRFPEARLLYTQSIAYAIGGSLGALAHSNRSAALFHMRLYKDCIKDIDRALILGYPKLELKYSLHLRKTKCLLFLKKDHTEALSVTLMAIEENNKIDCNALKASVLAKLEDPEPLFEVDLPKANKWKLPPLSYGPSVEVPSGLMRPRYIKN